ncbi:MAG: transcription antitermination factor NusB [Ruminococcaceae bacterium]|nr:transcription antitermination factor NusB [Oscillospiraceae bacterium]
MAMNRRMAREAAFELLFETEFKQGEARADIFALSTENREIGEDDYIKAVYFGVGEHQNELDDLINKHAKGWKVTRISRVSRSILRLAIFEMRYLDDVPHHVAINEAVELSKKFDEESARAFVNGVLNSIKDELLGAENV